MMKSPSPRRRVLMEFKEFLEDLIDNYTGNKTLTYITLGEVNYWLEEEKIGKFGTSKPKDYC